MVIEICLGIITFALVVLICYLVPLIKSVHMTLKQMDSLLIDAKSITNELRENAHKTVENAQLISASLVQKMDSLNPLFNTLFNTSSYLEKKSIHLNSENKDTCLDDAIHTNSFFNRKKNQKDLTKFAEIVELIGVGIRLWQKFKGDQ